MPESFELFIYLWIYFIVFSLIIIGLTLLIYWVLKEKFKMKDAGVDAIAVIFAGSGEIFLGGSIIALATS